jgi:hypothetical protein
MIHYVCHCDDDVALCGLDVSALEFVVDGEYNDAPCSLCYIVWEDDQPCPRCGCVDVGWPSCRPRNDQRNEVAR